MFLEYELETDYLLILAEFKETDWFRRKLKFKDRVSNSTRHLALLVWFRMCWLPAQKSSKPPEVSLVGYSWWECSSPGDQGSVEYIAIIPRFDITQIDSFHAVICCFFRY